ncbi:MAG: monofunctional biosynthetic peptidoglycan transglycosylase [Bacteriovoracaceae bacterium]
MGYLRKGISYAYGRRYKLVKWFVLGILGIFLTSVVWVISLRFVPVYFTPLMFIRSIEQVFNDQEVRMKKTWVPIEDISFNLQKSVISSEDPKFLEHDGFDFEAIMKAYEANKHRKVKMGASTISQQTAKNVFLYPTRSYVRKAFEAYFTVMIEFFWDKNRILEVYLNVIELGPGIYGAEAASVHYFKTNAKNLSMSQSQILAAILPNPRKWSPVHPSHYVIKRKNFVSRNLRNIGPQYFEPLKEAQSLPPPKKEEKKKKRKKR